METKYKVASLDRLASAIRKDIEDSETKEKVLGMIETTIEELIFGDETSGKNNDE